MDWRQLSFLITSVSQIQYVVCLSVSSVCTRTRTVRLCLTDMSLSKTRSMCWKDGTDYRAQWVPCSSSSTVSQLSHFTSLHWRALTCPTLCDPKVEGSRMTPLHVSVTPHLPFCHQSPSVLTINRGEAGQVCVEPLLWNGHNGGGAPEEAAPPPAQPAQGK